VAPNGSSELQGHFALKGDKAAVAPFNWTKETGVAGTLGLTLKLAPGAKLSTADFDGRGGGLTAKGQIRFGGDNTVQQVTLEQLALGRTDLGIDWKRAPGGVEIGLRGRALEFERVRQALQARDEIAKTTPGGAATTARESTRFSLQLGQVLMKRGSLGALNGRLDMAGERIASAELSMTAGKGATFKVQPAGPARTVAFYVADFGLLLHEAGLLDGLSGGYLDFRGRSNDAVADAPVAGTLKIGPYRMQKVAPRADVGSLNSAIDGLSRAGDALQQFASLEANITKVGERIEIKQGRTSGPSIGLTTAGTLDLATDTAHLRGVVVPGFAVNNLLSNVPVLGPLLTGGKNGGLFAFSYKLEGPFSDMKSDVNMMSALTPGALRELFSLSSDGTPPQPPESPPRAP